MIRLHDKKSHSKVNLNITFNFHEYNLLNIFLILFFTCECENSHFRTVDESLAFEDVNQDACSSDICLSCSNKHQSGRICQIRQVDQEVESRENSHDD